MDQTTRRDEIIHTLQFSGTCSILDLAQKFGVSDETIRRDIKQLEACGYVSKVHGGVRLPGHTLEAPYRQRQVENVDAKQRIGKRAAKLVQDGMTLFLDGSTTAFWVARSLTTQRNLSVVTNGIEVARELTARNNCRIFMAGGQVSEEYLATYGSSAIQFVTQFAPDIAFLGVDGISSNSGFCDAFLPEAELAQAVLKTADQLVIVADHSKFERRSLIQVCGFDRPDTLVCDKTPPETLLSKMHGTQILYCKA